MIETGRQTDIPMDGYIYRQTDRHIEAMVDFRIVDTETAKGSTKVE